MQSEFLSIVLLEDVDFKTLIVKMEKIFGIDLPFKNNKGRNIAKKLIENYELSFIDRADGLSELLCDEYHILEIKVNFIDSFDYEKFENSLLKLLDKGDIQWQRGVWTRLVLFEDTRIIYPKKAQ
jgi:hypothetical protein